MAQASLQVDNILELIGGTPLVRLRRLPEQLAANAAEVWVKCEQFNPGGSVKDRIALAMIEAAEREGRITPGRVGDRRADVGQHRHRAGAGVRGQGLPADPDHAGVDVARAALAAQGLRRRADPHAGRAHDGGRGRARRGAVPQEPELLHAAAVQQPGQPRGAPPHHRAGAAGAAAVARGCDAFVAGVGTGGTITGVGEVLQATAIRRADHRGRAGDLARCSRAGRSGRTRSRASAPASCPQILESQRHRRGAARAPTATPTRPRCALAKEEGLLVGISSGANAFVACAGGAGARRRASASSRSCATPASATSRSDEYFA